jgi:hypothetical protein
VPAGREAWSGNGRWQGGRESHTVLVCHLVEVSGFTAPRGRAAREAWLADVREYQALYAEVVQRFEGILRSIRSSG